MTASHGERIRDAAIEWTIRLRDADARAWEEFTLWLEADPDHLQAYEQVAALDASFDHLPRGTSPLPARAPILAGRRSVLGWAAAAAIAGVIGYATLQPSRAYAVETIAGERRTVRLADGSAIRLNGSSRIMLDHANERHARLERGEALFTVIHDDARPFRVEAGDALIEDSGTVFNVVRDPDRIVVEVAEGSVIFNPKAERVGLSAGMTLVSDLAEIRTGRRDPGEVGSWQKNELVYSSATLADVARDLTRNTGLDVRASAAVAQRRFSGVIILNPDRKLLLRQVSALLSVHVRQQGAAWVLIPADR